MAKRSTRRTAVATRAGSAGARQRKSREPEPRARAAKVRFENGGPKVAARLVSSAEQLLVPNRSKLPAEYRAFLLQHNGGTPSPGYFSWKHPKRGPVLSWVDHLLGLDASSLYGARRPDVISQLLLHRQQIPMSFLPIGYAVQDDILLLGINDWEESYGQIWIKSMDDVDDRVDSMSGPDDALYRVAPSFGAFLKLLHEEPADG